MLEMLRTDLIRRDVLKGEDIFDEKVASNMDKRTLVYDTMFALAEEISAAGEWSSRCHSSPCSLRRRRFAGRWGTAKPSISSAQSQCPQEHSPYKISQEDKKQYESNALTEQQAGLNNKERFEPVDLDDLKSRHLICASSIFWLIPRPRIRRTDGTTGEALSGSSVYPPEIVVSPADCSGA